MRATCISEFRHRALGLISRLVISVAVSAIVCGLSLPRSASADANKAQYELRERCGKQADTDFRREWGEGIQNTKDFFMTSDYTDHYNEKLNKCFVVLTVNSAPRERTSAKSAWDSSTSIELYEINEHKEYGSFLAPNFPAGTPPNTCWVLDTNAKQNSCRSRDEWNLMIRPYMEQ